ncbi:MAG: hypothetical protein QM767_25530 [Anaeromyxobacter sp.]
MRRAGIAGARPGRRAGPWPAGRGWRGEEGGKQEGERGRRGHWTLEVWEAQQVYGATLRTVEGPEKRRSGGPPQPPCLGRSCLGREG